MAGDCREIQAAFFAGPLLRTRRCAVARHFKKDVYKRQVTDHRIELTLYNLASVIEGELDPLIEPLAVNDLEEKLSELKL